MGERRRVPWVGLLALLAIILVVLDPLDLRSRAGSSAGPGALSSVGEPGEVDDETVALEPATGADIVSVREPATGAARQDAGNPDDRPSPDAAAAEAPLDADDPPRVHGRLVAAPAGEALARVQVSARSVARGGSESSHTLALTDDEGAFELRLDPRAIGTLELHLGPRYHEGHTLLWIEAPAIPTDGDLGTLDVATLRDVPFSIVERGGAAVAGAAVTSIEGLAARSDATGRGVLRWLPPGANRMRVVKAGFVPAGREVPELVGEPLEVVLERGNRLEIQIVPPSGGDVSQFRAVLRSEEVLVAGPAADRTDLRDFVTAWSYLPFVQPTPEVGSLLAGKPDEEGVVSFLSLRTELPLDLEIRGITGNAVYHAETLAPLTSGETRRHVVELGAGLRTFRGRVVDQDGNGLARASLQLGNQILGWTDEAGEFLCFTVEEPPKTLIVGHSDCAKSFIPDYVIPASGAPVEFRLEPALRVIIEVVDAAGRRIPDATVYIGRAGFTSNTHPVGDGRFRTGGMSSGSVEIEARVAGHSYSQEHDPRVPEARVVVPLHGSVAVELTSSPTGAGDFRVVLVEADTPAPGVLSAPITASSAWRSTFPLVRPGRYDVTLQYEPSALEKAAGVSAASVGGGARVSVEANVRSDVRMSPEGL